MKKLINLTLLFVLTTTFFSLNAEAEIKKNSILGEWIYEVSDAPYGYEKGSLIFSEKDGKTICVVKLEAGELTVSDLVLEKGKVSFTVMVEGSPVEVKLIREKDKLAGTVDSPEGPKTITALKK
ncbi:MAG: hypothetical protein WAO52_15145 [Prolixibacteraceae bacterium]